MREFIIKSSENGLTLEKYTFKVLKNAPMSFVYKIFRKKDIKVNGHWEKEKFIVNTGDEVSIYITDAQLKEFESSKDFQASDEIVPWIIYEDKNIFFSQNFVN